LKIEAKTRVLGPSGTRMFEELRRKTRALQSARCGRKQLAKDLWPMPLLNGEARGRRPNPQKCWTGC